MYKLQVLKKWWSYSYLLLAAILILNWFAFSTYDAESNRVERTINHSAYYGKTLLFVLLAPLANLYFWFNLCRYLDEAILDVGHHLNMFGTSKLNFRMRLFARCLWGAILLPLIAWPYTLGIETLWTQEMLFWGTTGHLTFSIFGALLPLVLPKKLPAKLQKLSDKFEEEIDNASK